MKKTAKIIIISISAVIILLLISLSVFTYNNNITSLEQAKAYAENMFKAKETKVLNEISDKSFDELLAEIKTIEKTDGINSDTLSLYHGTLADKMTSADKDKIVSAILDKSLSAESRSTIIMSAQGKNIVLDDERLSAAISDDDYKDIRSLLIDIVAEATPDNIEEIEKIVDNKSDGFSKAIKTLWKIKPKKAVAVADEIFAVYSGEYDEIFRGAFSVKSYQAMTDPTDKNCAEYIALCDKILNTPCDNAEGRETFIISWVQEIQNKQILIYCKEKGFENRMIGPYLSLTLSKMLDEPASVENVELFLYFYPYTTTHNVWEAVNKHLANNEDFYKSNPEYKDKLEQISAENYEIVSVLSERNK